MDLFGSVLLNGAIGAPAWSELPAEARAALTSLMTQLILDHAAAMATPRAKEVGHDL
jgi:acyl-CoA reductase-like NAD-dependent aldehyde dehydrogenase